MCSFSSTSYLLTKRKDMIAISGIITLDFVINLKICKERGHPAFSLTLGSLSNDDGDATDDIQQFRISQLYRFVLYTFHLRTYSMCNASVEFQIKIRKISRRRSFHVVVFQRTAKKCTKIYNARAQLLLCSLNFLFSGVLIAVAVVVYFLRSLRFWQQLKGFSFF